MHTDAEFEALQAEVESLKKQLADSKRSYSVKNEYMSHITHEIRTPMNSVIELAQVGLDECYGRAVGEYFRQIKKSAEYQLTLINDVLDMTRLERGCVTLYPEPCSIKELVQDVGTVIVPLMQKKRIIYDTDLEKTISDTIVIDKLRVKQILINLLSNASKFTPEGGRVRFYIEQTAAEGGKAETVFGVEDNGIGMSEEFVKTIFDPFTQEKNALTEQTKGTGLGMSISKELADLMGGTLEVDSKVGAGSKFTLKLMCNTADDSEVRANRTIQRVPDLLGRCVLVVDDHTINRVYEMKLLIKAGMETVPALNGAEAVEKFMMSKEGFFDVILMDIKMPVMDGLEAAKRIRALDRPDAKKVKILGMSANSYPEDIRASKDAGMNAHLGKPVSPQTLFSAIAEAFDE